MSDQDKEKLAFAKLKVELVDKLIAMNDFIKYVDPENTLAFLKAAAQITDVLDNIDFYLEHGIHSYEASDIMARDHGDGE